MTGWEERRQDRAPSGVVEASAIDRLSRFVGQDMLRRKLLCGRELDVEVLSLVVS